MKITTTIILIIFGAVLVSLITSGLVLQGISQNNLFKNSSGNSTSSLASNFAGSIARGTTNKASAGGLGGASYYILNTTEVAKHNSGQSCWMIISGKVYDVTDAINSHPGGSNEILKFCGQDATTAFNTKDGRGTSHSSTAVSMLAQYYIGDLNQKFLVSGGKSGSSGSIQSASTMPANLQTALNSTSTVNTNVSTSSTTSISQQTQAQQNQQTQTQQNQNTQTQTSGGFTASQVALHNNINDCWLIIGGKVYNVTSFIPSHPGGAGSITPYCGQDATVAFDTRGGTGAHSQSAVNMLANYYIGDLINEVASNQNNNQNNNSTSTTGTTSTSTTIGTGTSTGTTTTSPPSQFLINFTMAEFNPHNNINDCWVLINNSMVYNITNFIPMSGSDSSTLSSYCGKDATLILKTQDGQGSTSTSAITVPDLYHIGTIVG